MNQNIDDNCIFCKLAHGKIPTNSIYEDDDFKVILDTSPASRGHSIILPKTHAANIFELPDEYCEKIFKVAKKCGTAIKNAFDYEGLSWQKNSSWGDYFITTLTAYNSPKNIQNAIIHSDNIFFAQAALKIGAETFTKELQKIGFGENLNLNLGLSKSQISNNGELKKEIALADSGYGQGQILVNPVHMASIYSAFVNDGNMIKPYLEYKENKNPEYLREEVFIPEVANIVKENLIQVIENPEGTATDMKINGITLAGKTGTAELKVSKEEEANTLGWFNLITIDENTDKQYIIISMVEDARELGGSHYLIKKLMTIWEH